MIKAVIFDLDDTLCPEAEYVRSGFAAVARAVDIEDGEKQLTRLFDENPKNVFDRFASENGLTSADVARFVELYRNHTPRISLSDNVSALLKCLRNNGYALGIITDGRPRGQREKICALGLEKLVDKIIVTDELGIEYRKPHPKAFELMCDALKVLPQETAYVGDNPKKDFAVKKHLPVTTIQFCPSSGMYTGAEYLDEIEPDYRVTDLSELPNLLENVK